MGAFIYGQWAHPEATGFEQWMRPSTGTASITSSSVGGVDDDGEASAKTCEPSCLEVHEIFATDDDDVSDGPANDAISNTVLDSDAEGSITYRPSAPNSDNANGYIVGEEASRDDGRDREHHARTPTIFRAVWLTLGFASLTAGAVGIVLPGLPTTPFLLLSAFCFARSSDRFLAWLTRSRIFGPIIREWNENRALPSQRVKICAISLALLCFAASVVYFAVFTTLWWVSIILAGLCLMVCTFLLRLPVSNSNSSD